MLSVRGGAKRRVKIYHNLDNSFTFRWGLFGRVNAEWLGGSFDEFAEATLLHC
jgi:hypothetical protein